MEEEKEELEKEERELLEEIKDRNPTLYKDLKGSQEKARRYLRIVMGLMAVGILVLIGILGFLWGWFGVLLAGILVVIFSATIIQFQRVRPMERYTIEVWGNYLKIWGPGVHFRLRGVIKVSNEISLKEQEIRLFTAGEKLDIEQAKVGVKGVVTIKATNPLLVSYSVKGDTKETGPEKIKRLMGAAIQDVIQTFIKKHPKTGREMTYSEVITLKGLEMKEQIYQGKTRELFENWGAELLKVILEDFEPPPEETKARREVFEIQRKKEIKETEVNIKKLEGRAEAEKIKTIIWEIAKTIAGIFKEDDKLDSEERQEILKHWDRAAAIYLEEKGIAAVKSTDKMVITEGRGIGKTVGRDITSELIGRAATQRPEKEEQRVGLVTKKEK